MLTRQALRDKAMQGMLDVLNDAGTKSEIKVSAGITLMDMLLKDVQMEQAETQILAYKKLAKQREKGPECLPQEKGPFANLDPNSGHTTDGLISGRIS